MQALDTHGWVDLGNINHLQRVGVLDATMGIPPGINSFVNNLQGACPANAWSNLGKHNYVG